MTPDYNLMFLKTERDFVELDRNNLRIKITETSRLINNLIFLNAPESEVICARLQKTTLERELEKTIETLEDMRAQVEEAQTALEIRRAEAERV